MAILDFFNKKVITKDTIVIESNPENENSLIDKIHNEFYSEVGILLNQASQFNEVKNIKPELVDKRNRLYNLGFRNTPEMIEAEKEIIRLDILEKENLSKKELIETINYFSANYPEYKFITEQSVVNICNKYGLVYSTVDNFRGNIPISNLEQIEKFKIKDNDKLYLKVWHLSNGKEEEIRISDYNHYRIFSDSPKKSYESEWEYREASLEICAPLNQFDITDLELQDKKLVKKQLEIKDPIVLCPVVYNKIKYYLIVTAWGKEASDSEVINHHMN